MQNLIEIGQLGIKLKTCKVMKNVKLKKNKKKNFGRISPSGWVVKPSALSEERLVKV